MATWGRDTALDLFSPGKTALLADEVDLQQRERLESWGFCEVTKPKQILDRLGSSTEGTVPRLTKVEDLAGKRIQLLSDVSLTNDPNHR